MGMNWLLLLAMAVERELERPISGALWMCVNVELHYESVEEFAIHEKEPDWKEWEDTLDFLVAHYAEKVRDLPQAWWGPALEPALPTLQRMWRKTECFGWVHWDHWSKVNNVTNLGTPKLVLVKE